MPLLSILLGLVFFVALPMSGIVAAVLGWLAFRGPVTRWRLLGLAGAVLLPPYVIIALIDFGGAMQIAFTPHPLFSIPPVVAIVLAVVGIRRYRREQSESAARLRTEIQQEFRERFPQKPNDR